MTTRRTLFQAALGFLGVGKAVKVEAEPFYWPPILASMRFEIPRYCPYCKGPCQGWTANGCCGPEGEKGIDDSNLNAMEGPTGPDGPVGDVGSPGIAGFDPAHEHGGEFSSVCHGVIKDGKFQILRIE